MDPFEKMMAPSVLGISASTMTSHMHVDGVKRTTKGFELDVRMIDIKHTTVNMRRERLMLEDGKFKKWPRGNAWAELQAPLLKQVLAYPTEQLP